MWPFSYWNGIGLRFGRTDKGCSTLDWARRVQAAISQELRSWRRIHNDRHLGKQLRLPASKIRSRAQSGALYAHPKEKSIRRFMDQVRQRTKRRIPLRTCQLIEELNPLIRGWGEYYEKAHVRKLFHRLDAWIVHRIRSHRCKRVSHAYLRAPFAL